MHDAEPDDERGFALLIVLWALAGLSLLTAMVSASAGSALRETRLLRQSTQMQTLAQGGIAAAIFHAQSAPGTRWNADGQPHVMTLDGYRMTITLRSEAASVNPNTAPLPLLVALMEECGASPDQAGAMARDIVSWRQQARNDDRAERQHYLSAGLHYLPPHAAFQTVGELGLIPGMSAPLLARLAPHLSVVQPEELHLPISDPVTRRAMARAGMSALPGSHILRPESMTVEVSVTDGRGGMARRKATLLSTPDRVRVVAGDLP